MQQWSGNVTEFDLFSQRDAVHPLAGVTVNSVVPEMGVVRPCGLCGARGTLYVLVYKFAAEVGGAVYYTDSQSALWRYFVLSQGATAAPLLQC